MTRIKCLKPVWLSSIENLLFSSHNSKAQKNKAPANMIFTEARIKKALSNLDNVSEYEALILDKLNEKLNEHEPRREGQLILEMPEA